jgi:hypothetical protein
LRRAGEEVIFVAELDFEEVDIRDLADDELDDVVGGSVGVVVPLSVSGL